MDFLPKFYFRERVLRRLFRLRLRRCKTGREEYRTKSSSIIKSINRQIAVNKKERRMKRLVLSIMGVLMMTTAAFAGHPLVTDDTGTQGRGKGQVETALSVYGDKNKIDEVTTDKTEGGETSVGVTVGLTEKLDIVLGVPYSWYTQDQNDTRIARETGLGDIAFDAKWRFFEKDGWSLAFKPGITLPSGNEDKGLGAGRTAYRMFLVGTKELEPFAVHVNAGYIINENNADEHKDIWHASVACEFEVIKDLKLLANVGMQRNPDRASENHPAFALGGISYNVSERITVDAGVKYGLTSPETDWTVLTGMTIKF
jgi:opacity protein-like surface antigen